MKKYPNAVDVIWTQEEPRNQGAFYRMQFELAESFTEENPAWEIQYAGRPAAASPAVGHAFLHAHEQTQLVRDALGLNAVQHLG